MPTSPQTPLQPPTTMPTRQFETDDPAFSAIGTDASAVCAARLARVAGTHALLLDGMALPAPAVPGVARWTSLLPSEDGSGWRGLLRADLDALPFGDDSFCAVLVRFAGCAAATPEAVAAELARVLAPHGTLLISDLHPRSLWRAGASPGRWEQTLRDAGLEVSPALRCGSPWPRVRGAAGLPQWLIRSLGGAWVIEAHRSTQAAIPLRKAASNRRAVEHQTLLPGARRKSLNSLLRSAARAPAVLAMLTYWCVRSADCAPASRNPPSLATALQRFLRQCA